MATIAAWVAVYGGQDPGSDASQTRLATGTVTNRYQAAKNAYPPGGRQSAIHLSRLDQDSDLAIKIAPAIQPNIRNTMLPIEIRTKPQ